jgi:hypothetical protein
LTDSSHKPVVYRKLKSDVVWHFHTQCSNGPRLITFRSGKFGSLRANTVAKNVQN